MDITKVVKRLYVFLCLVLLTACSGSMNVPPTMTSAPSPRIDPSPTPVPQPQLIKDFTDGLNEMPPDKYLFIQYWTDSNGKSMFGTCEGAAMIDFPTYSFSSGSLSAPNIDISRGMSGVTSSPVGFFGYGNSNSGAMGGGAASQLYIIEALPYTMLAYGSYDIGIIHSVDAQGRVVVEIDKHTYLLEPGQSRSQVFKDSPNLGCQRVTTSSLSNYGLLDKNQVTTGSDQNLEYLQKVETTSAPYQLSWYGNEKLIFAAKDGIKFYATPALDQIDSWATTTPVISIAISPDKKILATADVHGSMELWDIKSGQAIGTPMSDPVGPWLSLTFSPDGKKLASGSWDGIIQLWDTATRQAIGSPWVTHTEQVTDIEYSSDGKWLLSSAGENQPSQVWDIATGRSQQWSRECVAMALSSDSQKLACLETDIGNGSPTLYIADVKTHKVLGLMADPPRDLYDLTFSPNGRLLAGSSKYDHVQLWDAGTGEIQGQWTIAKGRSFSMVTSVVFNPNGTKLAAYNRTIDNDWTIWLLDLNTNQVTQKPLAGN